MSSLEDYDYDLPKERIAQIPQHTRSESKLLVLDRSNGSIKDFVFRDIVNFFNPGDVLVLNNSKVISARILGKKITGGKVEILLLSCKDSSKDLKVWQVLSRPVLNEKQEVYFDNSTVKGVCLGRDEKGLLIMEFDVSDVMDFARRCGTIPLPPYIKRKPEGFDRDRYQTVYAEREGSVAAPTAGLHFTNDILNRIREKGVSILNVTLHVGYGTFKPVIDIESHRMHTESFEMADETAKKLNQALDQKKKIWAVGTTSVRVLETCALNQRVLPGAGETDLFLRPPQNLEIVGGLLTNFHWPRSTLLMLVSAFAGLDLIKKAYKHAIDNDYRFFSYGDCMLIV